MPAQSASQERQDITTEVALLRQELEQMHGTMSQFGRDLHQHALDDISALKEVTKALQALEKTWNQANGILNVIKWVAVVGAAIAGIYAGFRGLLHHT